MEIIRVRAGYPMMSDYPQRDDRRRRRFIRRRLGSKATDKVEISSEGYELAREHADESEKQGA